MNQVAEFFKNHGLLDRIQAFDTSSATVELAARAIGCPMEQIAKTISLHSGDGCRLIVAAGDAKIDNQKYKAQFGQKAVMLGRDEVPAFTGHPVGGVCPFIVKEGVQVYLDVSMKRFLTVYTACGAPNSVIGLTLPELEQYSGFIGWVDICKGWQD